jgi:hypothetical protein
MKFTTILLLIVILLLVIGCEGKVSTTLGDSFNYVKGDTFVNTGEHNFKQGVSELKIELLDGSPPDEIYPDTKFKIIVELKNEAAYDLAQGLVSVVGVDDTFFKVTPLNKEFPQEGFFLAGKSPLTPAGDRDIVSFDVTAGQLFKEGERHTEAFLIKAGYISIMDFVDTVCINPNVYELYDKAGCTVDGSESYSGQGAPLAVMEMEQITTPGAGGHIEFRLKLKNRGSGEVGAVRVMSAELGGKALDCHFKDVKGVAESVSLIDKKGNEKEAVLLCDYPLRNFKSYETTLSIRFEYEYTASESHSMTLVN